MSLQDAILTTDTIAMAMGFGGLGLTSVFMAPIEADLGWSRSDVSLGYALSTAGLSLGGLFWGRLADRMDLRPLLALGATGMVAPLLAMPMHPSLSVFYLAHVVYGGFGFSVIYSLLLSTSAEWFPERRGMVMGLVTAGGAAGQGLLPFFASFLISALGWRWAFAGIGGTILMALALALPILRWPLGTRAPVIDCAAAPASRAETKTVALLALAGFLCCLCMGVPVVHLASFIGAVCGSARVGVDSLLIAMLAGAIGRICCGGIADRIGPLKAYGIASAMQTAGVLAFPAFRDSATLMVLSAIFGFGFAGTLTCLSLCVRHAVPASRFGGAIGAVMMIAWAGMAAGGYAGGVSFDLSRSYIPSLIMAGISGILNLVVIGALASMEGLTPSGFSRMMRNWQRIILRFCDET
jgi:MFS family permease